MSTDAAQLAAQLEADMHSAFAPWQAASQSLIHDVIRPQDTRQAVIDGLFIGSGYRRPAISSPSAARRAAGRARAPPAAGAS